MSDENIALRSWLPKAGTIKRRIILKKLKRDLMVLGISKQKVFECLVQLATPPRVVVPRWQNRWDGLKYRSHITTDQKTVQPAEGGNNPTRVEQIITTKETKLKEIVEEKVNYKKDERENPLDEVTRIPELFDECVGEETANVIKNPKKSIALNINSLKHQAIKRKLQPVDTEIRLADSSVVDDEISLCCTSSREDVQKKNEAEMAIKKKPKIVDDVILLEGTLFSPQKKFPVKSTISEEKTVKEKIINNKKKSNVFILSNFIKKKKHNTLRLHGAARKEWKLREKLRDLFGRCHTQSDIEEENALIDKHIRKMIRNRRNERKISLNSWNTRISFTYSDSEDNFSAERERPPGNKKKKYEDEKVFSTSEETVISKNTEVSSMLTTEAEVLPDSSTSTEEIPLIHLDASVNEMKNVPEEIEIILSDSSSDEDQAVPVKPEVIISTTEPKIEPTQSTETYASGENEISDSSTILCVSPNSSKEDTEDASTLKEERDLNKIVDTEMLNEGSDGTLDADIQEIEEDISTSKEVCSTGLNDQATEVTKPFGENQYYLIILNPGMPSGGSNETLAIPYRLEIAETSSTLEKNSSPKPSEIYTEKAETLTKNYTPTIPHSDIPSDKSDDTQKNLQAGGQVVSSVGKSLPILDCESPENSKADADEQDFSKLLAMNILNENCNVTLHGNTISIQEDASNALSQKDTALRSVQYSVIVNNTSHVESSTGKDGPGREHVSEESTVVACAQDRLSEVPPNVNKGLTNSCNREEITLRSLLESGTLKDVTETNHGNEDVSSDGPPVPAPIIRVLHPSELGSRWCPTPANENVPQTLNHPPAYAPINALSNMCSTNVSTETSPPKKRRRYRARNSTKSKLPPATQSTSSNTAMAFNANYQSTVSYPETSSQNFQSTLPTATQSTSRNTAMAFNVNYRPTVSYPETSTQNSQSTLTAATQNTSSNTAMAFNVNYQATTWYPETSTQNSQSTLPAATQNTTSNTAMAFNVNHQPTVSYSEKSTQNSQSTLPTTTRSTTKNSQSRLPAVTPSISSNTATAFNVNYRPTVSYPETSSQNSQSRLPAVTQSISSNTAMAFNVNYRPTVSYPETSSQNSQSSSSYPQSTAQYQSISVYSQSNIQYRLGISNQINPQYHPDLQGQQRIQQYQQSAQYVPSRSQQPQPSLQHSQSDSTNPQLNCPSNYNMITILKSIIESLVSLKRLMEHYKFVTTEQEAKKIQEKFAMRKRELLRELKLLTIFVGTANIPMIIGFIAEYYDSCVPSSQRKLNRKEIELIIMQKTLPPPYLSVYRSHPSNTPSASSSSSSVRSSRTPQNSCCTSSPVACPVAMSAQQMLSENQSLNSPALQTQSLLTQYQKALLDFQIKMYRKLHQISQRLFSQGRNMNADSRDAERGVQRGLLQNQRNTENRLPTPLNQTTVPLNLSRDNEATISIPSSTENTAPNINESQMNGTPVEQRETPTVSTSLEQDRNENVENNENDVSQSDQVTESISKNVSVRDVLNTMEEMSAEPYVPENRIERESESPTSSTTPNGSLKLPQCETTENEDRGLQCETSSPTIISNNSNKSEEIEECESNMTEKIIEAEVGGENVKEVPEIITEESNLQSTVEITVEEVTKSFFDISDVKSISKDVFNSMSDASESLTVDQSKESLPKGNESNQNRTLQIDHKKCLRCKKPSSVVCERCFEALYCSSKCHELDWIEQHYLTCKPLSLEALASLGLNDLIENS